MKKYYYLFAVAALALASCSSDEVVESIQTSPGNEITFRPFNNAMTRATDASFGNGSSFKVTAYGAGATEADYFTNVVFSTTDGTTFTSETKYYWPKTYNLDFYAWQPSTLSATVGDYSGFSITPGATIGSQVDFVYGVTKDWGTFSNPTHNGSSGATINFRHAESKVVIKLKNTRSDFIITIGYVTIGNLRGTETFTWNGVTDGTTTTAAATATTDGQYTSGTLTYLNGTWSATSPQTSTYTVTMGNDQITDDTQNSSNRNIFAGNQPTARDLTSTAANHEMILIPQVLNAQTTYSAATDGASFAGAYISAQIKIQNISDDSYIIGTAGDYVTAMWPLTALTWLPGHKYTYSVDLGSGGYKMTNSNDGNNDLDPILENAEIKFVTVTVDNWNNSNVNISGGN